MGKGHGKKDNVLALVTENHRDIPLETILSGFHSKIVFISYLRKPNINFWIDPELFKVKRTIVWLITNLDVAFSPRTVDIILTSAITPDWLPLLEQKPQNCQLWAEEILRAFGGNTNGTFRILTDSGTDLLIKVEVEKDSSWWIELGERKGIATDGLFGTIRCPVLRAEGKCVLDKGDFFSPVGRIGKRTAERIISEDRIKSFAIGLNPASISSNILVDPRIAKNLLGRISISVPNGEMRLGKTLIESSADAILSAPSVIFSPKGSGKDIEFIHKGKMII